MGTKPNYGPSLKLSQSALNRDRVYRPVAFLWLALATASCLTYAALRPGLPDWWRAHGGGIPYVVFWITLAFAIVPRRKGIAVICIGVTVGTIGLEFLQLWQPQWLTETRSTRFGAALLGNAFAWADVPPYVIGGGLGYTLLRSVPLQTTERL